MYLKLSKNGCESLRYSNFYRLVSVWHSNAASFVVSLKCVTIFAALVRTLSNISYKYLAMASVSEDMPRLEHETLRLTNIYIFY